MDQPRHDVVRKAFSMPFTPKAISEIEPFILRRTHELLARISIDGETELLRNFAFLLPIVVIAEILGVPSSDTEQFYQWSAKLTAAIDSATPQDVEAGAEVIQTMTNYFATLLKQAEKLPQHSLIRMLHNDPMQLTASELNSGLLFLLVAGHETTKGLISNGIFLFANHPKVFREIKQHRELIPKAMEEVLRYDSPVQKMSRWTHEEVVFGDYTIPVGTTMTALIGAAHQDPSVFKQPELFNINRDDNRHLAFGVGLHRCLGSSLARLEAKIAFEAIFSVIKELRPVQHRWRTISALRCLDELVVHAVPE
ncbi:MAG: cytochrome P450 [bacterium]